MAEYHLAGRRATLKIYDIMAGLAVTAGLLRLFVPEGTSARFEWPSYESLSLFLALFFFIPRFILGAHRVMVEDIQRESRIAKIVFDVIMLWFQAIIFVIGALDFRDILLLQWTLFVLIAGDLLWLLIVRYFLRASLPTFRQWVCHNVVMGAFLLLNVEFGQGVELLLAASLTAMVFDLYMNRDFYFGMPASDRRLRIFVAGPYGDHLPEEEIAKNVETARHFGKEIALKGHVPFIPHTMLQGWPTDSRFQVADFKRIDYTWLDECDALFFIAPSKGADAERAYAARRGMEIFTRLEDIPPASMGG
jgi:hypothetical protein